jgi:stearoyl-CoA desaturase (delta-9 desaturase)
MAIVYTLITIHLTIISVTLYLHRHQAHRAVDFHPAISHFMRFWLWLTTGMITQQWVAIHRKHHRFTDQQGDPHSPMVYGLKEILFKGFIYYHRAAKNVDTMEAYGRGTPDDWIEQKLYTPYHWLGVVLLLVVDCILFSYWGMLIWILQMICIPVLAANVINGLGHAIGYRGFDTRDNSRNIIPIGIIICGEELHNAHHNNPHGAKFSSQWYEFDLGYFYLRILSVLGLCSIHKL